MRVVRGTSSGWRPMQQIDYHDDHRVTPSLHGQYRDVLRGAQGQIIWDRGWSKNVIVDDCRRLLAELIRGTPGALGIQGLQVGAGLAAWDVNMPPPTPAQTTL